MNWFGGVESNCGFAAAPDAGAACVVAAAFVARSVTFGCAARSRGAADPDVCGTRGALGGAKAHMAKSCARLASASIRTVCASSARPGPVVPLAEGATCVVSQLGSDAAAGESLDLACSGEEPARI